ncbi:MAG: hypothetical protein ACOX6L_11430 [Syntrophomonadaceae bacterium]
MALTPEEEIEFERNKSKYQIPSKSNKTNWPVIILVGIILISVALYSVNRFYFQTPGAVKGLVTWQYNNLIGTKPDVGATIFLFPSTPKTIISDNDASSFFSGNKIPEGYYYAQVNGNGNYEIPNVKPGKYMAIIISKNTNRNLVSDNQAKNLKASVLTKYFSDGKANSFFLMNLGLNKFENKDIDVQAGSTLDLSNDFGNTYFSM